MQSVCCCWGHLFWGRRRCWRKLLLVGIFFCETGGVGADLVLGVIIVGQGGLVVVVVVYDLKIADHAAKAVYDIAPGVGKFAVGIV